MSVLVVGAGVTGLSLVHHLRERGREVVAFEADDRPGGVVRSDRVRGHVVERGPHRIRMTDAVGELVEAVGLSEEVVRADDDLPLYVHHRGKLRVVPRSVGEFVRTDLLSASAKLRVLAEPFQPPGRDDEFAADYFRRKFGDEAYENVIEPLFSGIYASNPAAMPTRYALEGVLRIDRSEGGLLGPALRRLSGGGGGGDGSETGDGGSTSASEDGDQNRDRDDEGDDRSQGGGDGPSPPISFEGGLGRLPEALYRAHEDAVYLSTPVERVVPAEGTDRYRVVADGAAATVADVVVTAPAGAAADVLESVAPEAADRLSRLNYNPIAMVSLVADGVDRAGFGYQVHSAESLRTRGVTFVDSLFDREGLYTAFLGGMDDPQVLERSDEQLSERAAREFETVLGVRPEPIDVTRLRAYPAYDRSWRALDDLELPDGIHLATNYTARIGVPGRVREARSLAERLAGDAERADAGRSGRPAD